MITDGRLDILYLPLHRHNNHWALLKIDLLKRTFSCGDSLGQNIAPPVEDLALLKWWLHGLCPSLGAFTVVTAEFDMLWQCDSYSCGVIIFCVLTCLLLGYDP